jgi:hypothetical protein
MGAASYNGKATTEQFYELPLEATIFAVNSAAIAWVP